MDDDGDDTTIAPVSDDAGGGDPIANYRRYLEAHTGDRAAQQPAPAAPPAPTAPPVGAGPSIAPVVAGPGQGAGPSIAAPAPPAAAQAAPAIGIGGGAPEVSTPTLDRAMPNPLQTEAPEAPDVDQAPQAKKATKAERARAARQADQAPTIAGNTGAPQPQQPSSGSDITGDAGQATPASGHVVAGSKTKDGRPMVGVFPPDHSPDDFDQDKLKDAHTTADVFDALSTSKQNSYMKWWEQQHGSIDTRYNSMLADLGQRPDPNRDPTTKEKFTELMQFGLSLLQNARPGQSATAAIGASAQSTLAGQKAIQRQQTSDYDARVAAIQNQRNKEQADIGNAGNAVREDAMIQAANVRTANALKPPRPAPTRTAERTFDKQGNMSVRDDDPTSPTFGKWMPALGPDGKPLGPQNVTGPRGGSTAKSPARMAEMDDLIKRGVDANEALNRVYGNGATKQLDPQKTYSSIYQKARGLGETQEDAAGEAEQVTTQLHGQNWRASATPRGPSIPPKPPAVAPPIGQIGTDAQGHRWRNDGQGHPVLVQ
jgi:hypothetical protein